LTNLDFIGTITATVGITAQKVNTYTVPGTGLYTPYSTVGVIRSDGVMEVGKYIDMHSADTASGYDVRLTCTGSKKLTIDADIDTVSAVTNLKFNSVDYRDWIYPIGSIYTWNSATTNPATKIGIGTWSLVGFNGFGSKIFPVASSNNSITECTITVTGTIFHGSAWIKSNGIGSNQSINAFWGVYGGKRSDYSMDSVLHDETTNMVNVPDAGQLEGVPGDWMYFCEDVRSLLYRLEPIIKFVRGLTKAEVTSVLTKLRTYDSYTISLGSWERTA
jgi:hypothetical protein